MVRRAQWVASRRRMARLVGVVGCAVMAGLGVAPGFTHTNASATPAVSCSTPPAVFPISGIQPGMQGSGKTTIKGTRPVAFQFKVLGVLPDGIAVGVPLVVVQLTGSVMQQTHGGFYGMSGSPVYLKGRLAGAVSYGLVAGDNYIAGVTPAQPMINLFGYPSSGSGAVHLRSVVRLPNGFRAAVAGQLGRTAASVPGSLRMIPSPLAMSGATDAQLNRIGAIAQRRGLALLPYAGGSVAAPSGASAGNAVPGSPFAAVIAYGDTSFYGVGITTSVCGNAAVAWGHPFNFEGSTSLGYNAADVLTVAPDLSNTFGGTMIASAGGFRGTVDQDRMAGLRGLVGGPPPLTTIQSTTVNADLHQTVPGTVSIAQPNWTSLVALFHFTNDTTAGYDRFGAGSQTMTWRITGTDASGKPFSVSHQDITWSDYSVADDGSVEPAYQIGAIAFNPFERVQINSVTSQATVTQAKLTADITGLLSASSLAPTLALRSVLPVHPGGWVTLGIRLQHADGSVSTVLEHLRAPNASARLEVAGGQPDLSGCVLLCSPGSGPTLGAGSFAQLVAALHRMPARDQIITTIGGSRVLASTQAAVINGSASVALSVR